MSDSLARLPHKLTLSECSQLTLTGVTEVMNFDSELVALRTDLGILSIQGQDLQLKNLNLEGGQAAVDGTILALSYAQPRQGGRFWRRLWS